MHSTNITQCHNIVACHQTCQWEHNQHPVMEQWTIRQDYFSPTQLFLWESAIYEHGIELEDNKIFMKHEIQIAEMKL